MLEFVPREITVTVTASPTKGLEPTLALTERLIGPATGWCPICRPGRCATADTSTRCAEVARRRDRRLFVQAGDADPPAGEFTSALDVLERLAELGNPFARVGITGYRRPTPRSKTT